MAFVAAIVLVGILALSLAIRLLMGSNKKHRKAKQN